MLQTFEIFTARVAKVMFPQASVILSLNRGVGGVTPNASWDWSHGQGWRWSCPGGGGGGGGSGQPSHPLENTSLPPGQDGNYSQWVGGKHPTGIHSCYQKCSLSE